MANKHVRKYSISLASRKIKIKTMITYHYTHIIVAKTENSGNTKYWQLELSCIDYRNASWYPTVKNHFVVSYDVIHTLTSPTLNICLSEMKAYVY